jgi:5'-methylthioadenosine phosphorylase
MALSTDYDCWRVGEAEVSVEAVIAVVRANAALASEVIVSVARGLPETPEAFPYPRSLTHAIMTSPARIVPEVRSRIDLIAGHLL